MTQVPLYLLPLLRYLLCRCPANKEVFLWVWQQHGVRKWHLMVSLSSEGETISANRLPQVCNSQAWFQEQCCGEALAGSVHVLQCFSTLKCWKTCSLLDGMPLFSNPGISFQLKRCLAVVYHPHNMLCHYGESSQHSRVFVLDEIFVGFSARCSTCYILRLQSEFPTISCFGCTFKAALDLGQAVGLSSPELCSNWQQFYKRGVPQSATCDFFWLGRLGYPALGLPLNSITFFAHGLAKLCQNYRFLKIFKNLLGNINTSILA